MDVSLEPMPTDALAPWFAAQSAMYEQTRRRSGDDPETARRAAEESAERFFPGGVLADGHEVLRIVADGRPVGAVWIGPHPDGSPGSYWVYEIEVDEAERGNGYGRTGMRLAEQRLRGLGATTVALNVAGDNAAARALYESLGYDTAALLMRKTLS